MTRRTLIAFLLLVIPITLQSQATPSLSDIDFSMTQISQSGPESFYLRNVILPDQTVSITLSLREDGAWGITRITSESENLVPEGIILDFATVEVIGDDKIEIDWIICNGKILSGVLELSDGTITLAQMFSARGYLEDSVEYPKALADLLKAGETTTSQAELASLREEYERKLSELSSSYDTVAGERNTFKVNAESTAAERDALKVEIDELKEEMASLKTLQEDLETENASLQSMIDSLENADMAAETADPTVSASESLVRSYIDKLDDLQGEISSLQIKLSLLESRIASDIDKAENSILASLSALDLSGRPAEQIERSSSLEAQIADLKAENASLTRQIALIDEEIRSNFMKNGFIAMLRPTLTTTLLTGFEPSYPQLGLWYVGEKSAKQIDKSMLFGKLILPVTQDDRPFLYSFKARSTDPANEWVGLGLHIFVENVEKRGYGLGDSLLVWLTRDQEVYKNSYTYLQL